jgi:small conductance mechanosensitive channel
VAVFLAGVFALTDFLGVFLADDFFAVADDFFAALVDRAGFDSDSDDETDAIRSPTALTVASSAFFGSFNASAAAVTIPDFWSFAFAISPRRESRVPQSTSVSAHILARRPKGLRAITLSSAPAIERNSKAMPVSTARRADGPPIRLVEATAASMGIAQNMFVPTLLGAGSILDASTWTALVLQVRASLLELVGAVVGRLPAVVIAGIVLALTRQVAKVARRSALALSKRAIRSTSLALLLEKTFTIGTWIVGVTISCLLVFPGLRLGDLVATLGLGTVAIGFAFQDIFKNFLAGVLLLAQEPFRIGDSVVIGNYEGVVAQIEIRTTNIRTYDGELVLVPNSIVFTSPVQVRTHFGQRRTSLAVGVGYETDLATALPALAAAIVELEGVANDPKPLVDATSFDESSIGLVVRYWTPADSPSVLRTKSRVVVAIKAYCDANGISLPWPIRTVVFAEPKGA